MQIVVYEQIIGDIIVEMRKITTLLPVQIERVLNNLLVFEGYYYRTSIF